MLFLQLMKLKKKSKRILIIVGIIFLAIFGVAYYLILKNNIVFPKNKEKEYLYIPTGAKFEDVIAILENKKLIKDITAFTLLSKSVGYNNAVLPGRYRLKNNMNNFELVRLLRSGKQEPVKLIIKGSQSMQNFLEYVADNLEITLDALNSKLNDAEYLKQYNLTPETATCLIIPNTYELYWNISLENFMLKMHDAYDKFWTEKRVQQCKDAGLTRTEVIILSSIIEKETDKDSDMPIIAGVYINRLAKGMKLQADPTVLFAMHDNTSKRVYSKMLDYDSPYNTYMYKGLPPGPICIPAIQSIDAVLNYQQHHFIYFCARNDGSGYSDFAENYDDHRVNAKKYQHYLEDHNIK